MKWIPLRLINGWVAPVGATSPHYAVTEFGEIIVAGWAVPTKDPKLPFSRVPEEIRPFETVEGAHLLNEWMELRWRVEPDGYVYIEQRHVLEGL